ncbi:MAG: hypothetical protein IKE38_00225 [Erysipelotrichaceae bacterium]|nr:hypothetical protein [Erysipelotrichaceae bacterium]
MSRFDETIKKMQDITSAIKEKADSKLEGLDEETSAKIKTVSEKTIDVINEAAFKLKSAVDQIDNEEGLNEFLDRVEAKCESAKKYAYEKIEEIAPEEEDDPYERKSTMEKFLENDSVRSAAEFITNLKDGIIDIYNSPKVQLKLNEAKLTVLSAADKGLDIIKNALSKDKE